MSQPTRTYRTTPFRSFVAHDVQPSPAHGKMTCGAHRLDPAGGDALVQIMVGHDGDVTYCHLTLRQAHALARHLLELTPEYADAVKEPTDG